MVFFCFLNLLGCKTEVSENEVTVNYIQGKAVSVTLQTAQTIADFDVFLKGNTETAVLGNFSSEEGLVTFSPVIPFTEGETYMLSYGKQLSLAFTINENLRAKKTELISIYPSIDKVPENLLKMYFVFSEPMQEVTSALEFIKVTNLSSGQEESIFLDLPTELWSADHKQLTLWLDPGRIKTDLIPNREQGLPLVEGNDYRIVIDSSWRDAKGSSLSKAYRKTINVGQRDNQKPDLASWNLNLPKVSSKDALIIEFNETLDAMLAKETMTVINSEGVSVMDYAALLEDETGLAFYPNTKWESGNYELIVEHRLEDLAGNNLDHLFDADLEASADAETKLNNKLRFHIPKE